MLYYKQISNLTVNDLSAEETALYSKGKEK